MSLFAVDLKMQLRYLFRRVDFLLYCIYLFKSYDDVEREAGAVLASECGGLGPSPLFSCIKIPPGKIVILTLAYTAVTYFYRKKDVVK